MEEARSGSKENEVFMRTLDNMQAQIGLMKELLKKTSLPQSQNDSPVKGLFAGKGFFMDKSLGELPPNEFSDFMHMGRSQLVDVLAKKIAETDNEKIKTEIQHEVEKKKHRLSVDLKSEKLEVFKIVFTGGPCAGKTTAITKVAEQLREKGYTVYTVPEAATMIFQSGGEIVMDHFTEDMKLRFQYFLMMLQMSLEDILAGLACIADSKNVVILCDRGTMDGSAYLSKREWEQLLSTYDLTLHKIRDTRYDLIIHISSAANGAEGFYSVSNNQARSEALELARALDLKLEEAWIDHPNFVQINNGFNNFDTKIESVLMTVFKFLAIPVSLTFYKKFLIANPQGNLTSILHENDEINVHNFDITDIIFFKGTENRELSYFRKRVE